MLQLVSVGVPVTLDSPVIGVRLTSMTVLESTAVETEYASMVTILSAVNAALDLRENCAM